MSTNQPRPFNTDVNPQPAPAGQGYGQPPLGPPPMQAAPPERNILAIVALATAVLGFIFAIWEGAYIIGWILLPISFVLALVSLFLKGKSKKLGIAALIVSIVGGIAGGIAFMSSAARVFEESFSTSSISAMPTTDPAADSPVTDAPADAGEDAEQTSGDLGTRDNPYPLGTTLSSDDWQVTINSFTPDATEAIMAENSFNDPPADGNTYAMVNLTATYVGADKGSPFELTFSYVTAAGNVVETYDSMVVIPDDLPFNDVYSGASVTGSKGFEIPAGDNGVLRVQLGLFSDEVFVALQ